MMRLFYLFLERVHNKRISPQGPKQINRNKQQKKAAQTAKQILKGKKKKLQSRLRYLIGPIKLLASNPL